MANEDFTSNKATKKARKVATPKARTHRKSRINPKVIANIIHLSIERRKESARNQWSDALKIYLATLNDNDFNIAQHVVRFIAQKPCAIDTSYLCEVIPFPAIKK